MARTVRSNGSREKTGSDALALIALRNCLDRKEAPIHHGPLARSVLPSVGGAERGVVDPGFGWWKRCRASADRTLERRRSSRVVRPAWVVGRRRPVPPDSLPGSVHRRRGGGTPRSRVSGCIGEPMPGLPFSCPACRASALPTSPGDVGCTVLHAAALSRRARVEHRRNVRGCRGRQPPVGWT